MLPSVSQTTSGPTRRTALLVAVLAVATMLLPTMKWATQAQSAAAIADETADRKNSRKTAANDRREKPGTETRVRDAAVEVEYLPRPSRFEEQVLAALEKPTDVEFSMASATSISKSPPMRRMPRRRTRMRGCIEKGAARRRNLAQLRGFAA